MSSATEPMALMIKFFQPLAFLYASTDSLGTKSVIFDSLNEKLMEIGVVLQQVIFFRLLQFAIARLAIELTEAGIVSEIKFLQS